MPVHKQDSKGPRMRKGQFSKMVITRELWKRFTETFSEYKDMTWLEFYQSWLDMAETVRHEAICNPLGVKLGSFMGELKMQYLPYKFEAIDYNASQELGEKIAHTSIQTKGKAIKIKWERRWAVKRNKILQFYAFDATRDMNRIADKYVSENPEKIRVARNTLGGQSVWRTKLNRYAK